MSKGTYRASELERAWSAANPKGINWRVEQGKERKRKDRFRIYRKFWHISRDSG